MEISLGVKGLEIWERRPSGGRKNLCLIFDRVDDRFFDQAFSKVGHQEMVIE
jgi:hypothetical protein